MRTIRTTLLASALLIAFGLSHGEAAAQFSGVYFFGDSLSDAGTFKPVLPPGTGKFTTNPGPVWVEVFAQRYGFTATPANQGGTDYAEGGARVALLPGVPPITSDRDREPGYCPGAEFSRQGRGRSRGAVLGMGGLQRLRFSTRARRCRRNNVSPTAGKSGHRGDAIGAAGCLS